MKHLNIIDELCIKVVKAPALTAVQRNEAFRAFTDGAHVACYSVNNTRCLGVSFDDPQNANIKLLINFCEKVLLESAVVPVPWGDGCVIVFIRLIDRWTPACLQNYTTQKSSGKGSNQ